MPRLLLIEDDVMIGSGIRLAFRQESFVVDWVQDRLSAERAMHSEAYAAVLLDIEFPRHERLNSIDWLRGRIGRIPVIVIGARMGSSDMDLDNLIARVRAALRGTGPATQDEIGTIALPFTWG